MVAAETLTGLTENGRDNEGLNLYYNLSLLYQRTTTPSQVYDDDYDNIGTQVFEDMAAEELTQSEDTSDSELY